MPELTSTAALWFLPFALPISLWAAWSDMRFMRIPNQSVLALAAVYLVVGAVALPFETYLWQLTHLAVVLVAGFVLSLTGLVGAGDAKFAAAMAPFVALGDVGFFLPLLAAVTLAAFVTHRSLARVPAFRARTEHWESWHRREFPMGLALGGALIFYLALTAAPGG